jgi:hypothetical protein
MFSGARCLSTYIVEGNPVKRQSSGGNPGRQAANLLMAGPNLRQLHEPRFGLPRS